jgi:hypothetical protein
MALQSENQYPAFRIPFAGLNTHISELFIQSHDSPEMLNVDLDPVGSMRKRDGLQRLQNAPYGSTSIDMVSVLYRPSESLGFLYVASQGHMSALDIGSIGGSWSLIHAPAENLSQPCSTTAAFAVESGPYTGGEPTSVENKGECLYVCDGSSEPFILGGGMSASSVSQTNEQIEVSSGAVLVTITGHGYANYDIVTLSGISSTSDWYSFENRSFFVEEVTANTFYLLDGDFTRVAGSAQATETTGIGSSLLLGNDDHVRRWPLGVYDATNPRRGYPRRWADPDETWTTEDFPPGPTDWPSATTYVGTGLGARMFAYGFSRDPSRVDYSELGVPYNFLHSNTQFADEAAASLEASPAIDGGYFYCMAGDGDRVVAVRDLMGYVVVFKTKRTVLYQGELGEYFRVAQEYPVGALSNDSVVKVGNDIYFWSYDGPRKLSTTAAGADLIDVSVSADVIEVSRGLTTGQGGKVIARHERLNQRIIWHFPDESTRNDACLVYYYPSRLDQDGRWSNWGGKYAEMSQAVAFENPESGSSYTFGGSNSERLVYIMNTGSYDDYDEVSQATEQIEVSDSAMLITVSGHGLSTGDSFTMNGIDSGSDWFSHDGNTYYAEVVDDDTFYARDALSVRVAASTEATETTGIGTIDTEEPTVIEMLYRTRWYDAGEVHNYKRGLDLMVIYSEEGSAEVEIEITYDYDSTGEGVSYVLVPMSGTSGRWNFGFWNDGTWNMSGRSMVTYEAGGLGKIFSLTITDSSRYHCGIAGMVLGLSRKGTR